MGLLDALGRAFCAGAEVLAFGELHAPVRRGETLRATVEVTGAEGLRLEGLELRLDEERVDFDHPRSGGFRFWREAAALVLALDGRALAPGQRLRVPLLLKLPADLEPSAPHRRYRLTATVKARRRHPGVSVVVAVLV